MTPEEMAYRIKRLEQIVLDLHYRHGILIPTVCFNASLHAPVLAPHYTDEPQIAWNHDIIHLNPEWRNRHE